MGDAGTKRQGVGRIQPDKLRDLDLRAKAGEDQKEISLVRLSVVLPPQEQSQPRNPRMNQ